MFLYCTLDNELIDFIQSTPYFRAWRDEVWRCLCRALWPLARSLHFCRLRSAQCSPPCLCVIVLIKLNWNPHLVAIADDVDLP